MKPVLRFTFAVLSLSSVLAGCDRRGQPATDARQQSTPTDATGESASRPSLPDSASPCPRTGRWAICTVEKRLEQSGFVLRKVERENPRRLGFSVQPVVYELGRARLEIFLYPDDAALTRDLASIDTLVAAPRGRKNDWEVPPRFVRSANLIAVFLTRNEQQAERLTLAITAGPPQR